MSQDMYLINNHKAVGGKTIYGWAGRWCQWHARVMLLCCSMLVAAKQVATRADITLVILGANPFCIDLEHAYGQSTKLPK
jgi:hypothetical protein